MANRLEYEPWQGGRHWLRQLRTDPDREGVQQPSFRFKLALADDDFEARAETQALYRLVTCLGSKGQGRGKKRRN